MTDAINQQICPEWIMKSKSVLGRCVPSITEDEFDESNIAEDPNSKVTWQKLKEGVENLANLLGLKDIATNVFNDLKDNWWTILIGLIMSSFVSFLWIVLMRYNHFKDISDMLKLVRL